MVAGVFFFVLFGVLSFFRSDLRQSNLAICNFGTDAASFFLENWTISQFGFTVYKNVAASFCRPEQILIHRDGVGLSELTAECTQSFGNCLWGKFDAFFPLLRYQSWLDAHAAFCGYA